MSTVDLTKNVVFEKSIVVSRNEGLSQDNTGAPGQIRFNQKTLKFEGYNCYPNSDAGADIFGNRWRPLTQDIASTSNLGVFKVGTNLNMNPSTGRLSCISTGISRIYQLVITISPIFDAADYQTINYAITDAIGTPANNYTDGKLTLKIESAPSPTYPFIILLGPGQYSEPLNTIVLPDYVSLMGDGNYTSVITQNSGSATIANGSLINTGQNSYIKNISIVLDNTTINGSPFTNAIYSLNKSNVVIDNCIIQCSSTINSNIQAQTYGIYMNGGSNNRIINNTLTFNSSTLLGSLNSIYITNTTAELMNNTLDILSPRTINTIGVSLNNCIGTESINDKLYIENLTVSNNTLNTSPSLNTSNINIGINITNTPLILKNSYIEVSNDPQLSTNYGININSNSAIQTAPYIGQITSNVISFLNTQAGVNSIRSSNIAILNFLTQHYERGQYISVSGSSLNDSIYKIASIPTSNIILLENGYTLNTELKSPSNTITLQGLYDINMFNTKISGSTNTIQNSLSNLPGTNNYIVNLNNVINEGGTYNISPSYVFYSNYKTITVGKANCDYTNLVDAMESINDNSTKTRYLIKIQSGLYQDNNFITCKEYVDIEGNGEDNTIINVNNNNTAYLVMSSHCSLRNMSINMVNVVNVFPSSSVVSMVGNNIILENMNITMSTVSTIHNVYCINIRDSNTIVLRNVNISAISSISDPSTGSLYGIFSSDSYNCEFYNISTNVNSTVFNNCYSIYLEDSECNIYNSTLLTHSGQELNIGIYTQNTNNTQKLVQLYNGQIRSYDNIDYSIYGDNYYTILCTGVQLLGETYKNSTSSIIYCNGCYTFDNQNDKYNITSLNSRGQNEQIQNTLTLGDTAGNRNASGINNVFVGVNSGSNVTTASYNTFLGSNTGRHIQTANNNTLIGSYAGTQLTTGFQNTILGSNAGVSMTTGSNNLIHGYNSGYSLTTGNNNVILGTSAGSLLTTGNLNVFIGNSAGLNTTLSNDNTFIGNYSGISNQTGKDNTYLGYNTGNNSITGSNNILIGKEAGYTNLTSNIVAIGNQAGYNNTNSIKNTYIGHNSGYNNTTGICNTYLGYKSGYSNSNPSPSSASFNIAIGNEAGYSLTSGARNILIGSAKTSTDGVLNTSPNDSAGWALQTGTDNIHIGSNSGAKATSAINNVLIGTDVGTSIITSSNNILIGKSTGNLINTKSNNIIIGAGSGNNNNYGNALIIGQNAGVNYTGNVAFTIGHNAGNNVSGEYNMYIGQNSGGYPFGSKTGKYNLAIGPYAGYFLSSGNRNVIVGSGNSINSAGRNISVGSDNTLLGYNTGKSLQTGNGNTLLGSQAGFALTSGVQNLILGYQSAYNLATGSQNVSLGSGAGYSLTIGNRNIFTGYQSGYNTTTGSNNINIGVQAGYIGKTSLNNVHIGYRAGYSSNGNYNLFLGSSAGSKNTSGQNNIFLGLNSGSGANSSNKQIGNNNMFMGTNSGRSNYNGFNNIFVGMNSGRNNINGSKNIFIGENTGSNTNLSHNIFIGTATVANTGVGYLSRTTGLSGEGEKNVFIGHDVGIQNTVGNGNIFLGDSAGEQNTTGLQNIYIGTNAGNKGTNENLLTANYNIALGYNAGINNTVGQENILIGKNVASETLIGNSYYQNIIIGSEAGQHINQNNQIFIGTRAGQNNTTGDRNIFIGLNAGALNTTSPDNVIIGSNAGASFLGTGTIGDNVLIGSNAGKFLQTGINNIYLGSGSGKSSVFGSNNVLIGTNTMNDGDANNVVMIGTNAGFKNNADRNVFIGLNAGKENILSVDNVVIGNNSGIALIGNGTTGNNVLIGSNSGNGLETGYNNIYIGSGTANNASTGINNIVIGLNAMHQGNANNVIMIGNNTGYRNNGDRNIFIGYDAGISNVNSIDNVVIGSNAGISLIGNGTEGNNILIGSKTGNALTIGTNNIYIGTNAGEIATTSINNIVIGANAMNDGNADNVVIIGSNAGLINNGDRNIFIGANAGSTNIDSTDNVVIGSNAGISLIGSGSVGDNILIGFRSGENLETGTNNIYIGSRTGKNTIDSINNIIIGTNAMNNGNAKEVVIIGNNAGLNNNADGNIFIGSNAGVHNINGERNIFIGLNAGSNNINSPDNVVIGSNAGVSLIGTGVEGDNILIGSNAGHSLLTGTNNIYIGSGSGANATVSINNVVIGTKAMHIGNANDVVIIGNNAGQNNNADGNICIGSNAGVHNINGERNIYIGLNAGSLNINSADNVVIGSNAGVSFIGINNGNDNDNGNGIGNNILVGSNAGHSLLTGTNNIFIGSGSGSNATTSINNVIIGTKSMNTGNANEVVIIGNNAGLINNGDRNIFIGINTGKANMNSTDNVVIGSNAGISLTGHGMIGDNVLIGSNAGYSLQAGINNIYIGTGAGANSSTSNNNVVIGCNAMNEGNSKDVVIIGVNAGLNNNADGNMFIGSNAGVLNTRGEHNLFIGLNAGKSNINSDDNIIIGSNAGVLLTGTGNVGANILIGSNAGKELESCTNNIFIGANTGSNTSTSINNVVIGSNSMYNTTANNVVFIGNNAGLNNAVDGNIFIGSNAGVSNTDGSRNLFIGYQSGYNLNSNGNIIFGHQSISKGQIADNNIIIGNESAKNVNTKSFTNNILIGANAGQSSNLSIHSIVIGANALHTGTGGEANIIMGHNSAPSLGNQNPYYASTTSNITTLLNNVYINIPFGTGGYYFKTNDYILIESNNTNNNTNPPNYIFQTQLTSVLPGKGINSNKTHLIFISKPTQIINSGAILYVKNTKQDVTSITNMTTSKGIIKDYSKSSSNMCMGDTAGYALTTGSKNSALGDSAMYNNKIGNYNMTFGPYSGYNINTNNNLCLGTQAGYSIDKYKNNIEITDFIFNSNTNIINSNSSTFENYLRGTVFDIEGSSSNDSRYNIKYMLDSHNIVVNSDTYINETIINTIPITDNDLQITSNSYEFTNNTYTCNNVVFSGNNITLTFDTSTLAQNFVSNSTIYFTIANSRFNDGIKITNAFNNNSNNTINNNIVNINTLNVYNGEDTNNLYPISIIHNAITATSIPDVNTTSINSIHYFDTILSNETFFVGNGKNSGIYTVSKDYPYFFQDNNVNTFIPYSVCTITNNQFNTINNTNNYNTIYIKGNTSTVQIVSNVLNNTIAQNAFCLTQACTLNPTYWTGFPNLSAFPCLIKFTGNGYSNYYYIKSFNEINSTAYLDTTFSITQIPGTGTDPYNNSTNIQPMRIDVCEIQNASLYTNLFTSSNKFNGSIVNIRYRTDDYYSYASGAYIVEYFYKDNLALNKNVLQYTNNNTKNIDININYTTFNAINVNNYISSYDLIFQTSNISYTNISLNNITSTLATITSSIDYDFVDVVAPTLIKIEATNGSSGINSSNTGFYLVTENKRPFKTLTIKGNFTTPQNNISNVTIKTKCVSSYYGLINLSNLQVNTQYTTFGSNYNHNTNFSIYNNTLGSILPNTSNSTITTQSIYLSDSTTIENDSYNKFDFKLLSKEPQATEYYKFQHIELNNISMTITNGTTFSIDANSNVGLQSNLNNIINHSYLKISSTSSVNDYTGLYCINSIVNTSNVYTLVFNGRYERGGIIYNSPSPDTDPFYNSTYPTSINNCYMLLNQCLFTYDPATVINNFGENAKFLSFSIENSLGYSSDNQESLTFTTESYNLNVSNVSVSLSEVCPNDATYLQRYLSFGVPSPSTRLSTIDIHRKNNRPLMYSTKNIYLTGNINLYTSNNAVSISLPNRQYPIDYHYNIYYGKIYNSYNFEMFQPGQMIYLQTSTNSGAYKINTISNDYNTLYFDTAFSTVSSNESRSNITIDMKYILNNENINFSEFALTNSYIFDLSINKNPISESIPNNFFGFRNNQILTSNASNLVLKTSLVKPTTLQEYCMNHTIIIPTSNIDFNYTNLSFHNLTKTGANDISFYSSNNSITSIITDLSGFKTSEYILISNTTNNNYLYRINDTIAPTQNKIIVSSTYPLVNENNTSSIIRANNINTSNSSVTDLSLFYGGQKLIISNTTYNNTTNTAYTSNINSNSAYSIFIDSPNVVTETPNYCTIEKSILNDEHSIITTNVSDISFNTINKSITSLTTDLSGFRTGELITISNTGSNDNTYTISSDIIPTTNTIVVNETIANDIIGTNAIITKNVNFNIVGEPIQTTLNNGLIVTYNSEDCEGNNCMIGSFAGQYTGSLNNAIYNVAIGSRCAQVNHGSGNIFIGNESITATSNTQVGATTYNNKFAIYRTNNVGVPQNPLLGGDFGSGKVGINTITPEAFSISSDILVTDTKLVVNGSVLANSYSPFTGCHLINFTTPITTETTSSTTSSTTSISTTTFNNTIPNLQIGMIVSSTGIVKKASIVNIFCTVELSKVQNDKTVFGVYAFSEQTKSSKENDYIIDSNGKYIKNSLYIDDDSNSNDGSNSNITTLYYAAAIGEGCILVTNYSGEIQNGDYITTSPIPGYGSLQNDDIMYSYTVAKCTETIDWDTIKQTVSYNGAMYKVYLTSCTYHCG